MGEMTAEGVQVIRTETMIQEMTENMNIVLRLLGDIMTEAMIIAIDMTTASPSSD